MKVSVISYFYLVIYLSSWDVHSIVNGREEDEEDYQERIEQQLAKQDEEDVDKIKEESRKRRQAILEKYKQRQVQQHVESSSNDNVKGNSFGIKLLLVHVI